MPGAVRGGTLHIALVNAPRNPQSPDSPVGSSDFEFLVPFPKSPISTYSKMALLGLGLLSSACFSDPRWICWANRNLATTPQHPLGPHWAVWGTQGCYI